MNVKYAPEFKGTLCRQSSYWDSRDIVLVAEGWADDGTVQTLRVDARVSARGSNPHDEWYNRAISLLELPIDSASLSDVHRWLREHEFELCDIAAGWSIGYRNGTPNGWLSESASMAVRAVRALLSDSIDSGLVIVPQWWEPSEYYCDDYPEILLGAPTDRGELEAYCDELAYAAGERDDAILDPEEILDWILELRGEE
jgi:hypothetical protein